MYKDTLFTSTFSSVVTKILHCAHSTDGLAARHIASFQLYISSSRINTIQSHFTFRIRNWIYAPFSSRFRSDQFSHTQRENLASERAFSLEKAIQFDWSLVKGIEMKSVPIDEHKMFYFSMCRSEIVTTFKHHRFQLDGGKWRIWLAQENAHHAHSFYWTECMRSYSIYLIVSASAKPNKMIIYFLHFFFSREFTNSMATIPRHSTNVFDVCNVCMLCDCLVNYFFFLSSSRQF